MHTFIKVLLQQLEVSKMSISIKRTLFTLWVQWVAYMDHKREIIWLILMTGHFSLQFQCLLYKQNYLSTRRISTHGKCGSNVQDCIKKIPICYAIYNGEKKFLHYLLIKCWLISNKLLLWLGWRSGQILCSNNIQMHIFSRGSQTFYATIN